jgi:hypothetical protein
MRDVEAIETLCGRLGGLTAMAAELSKDGQFCTPQQIYAWRKHGRVAPEHRQRFLSLFNRVMPKAKHLALTFLATPAMNTNGSGSHGRTSGRKAQPKGKRQSKAARSR